MRLIDADALNASLLYWDGSETKYCYPCREILTTIDAQPTVDAVPVRHGCWSEHKDYPGIAWQCSECGCFTTMRSYHYCPNCGARMDWGDGDPNGFNEETIKALKDTTERKNLSKAYETLDDMYADMETDCVPVIRCKDCAYYRPYSDGRYDCDNMLGMADAYEDGFCSRAERKTK